MQREPCPSRYRILFPAFLDLAQDRVRSRLIFPLVTLAIYILIAFAIIGALKKEKKPPSELKARLPFPNKYGINTAVNSTFPSPRILVSNSEGIMPNKTIMLKMQDLIASDDPAKPDCDASRRSAISGSLEYIRYKEVCRVEILNSSVVSDKEGEAFFDGLQFVRMPQGSYYFTFEDEEKYAKSQEFSIFFQSNAIKLEVLTPPPFQQAVGKPFQNQPKIRILDQNGKIIKNKKVVAFSWAEPRFSGSISAYFPENGRYALLGGDLSSPSDDNGVASFSNLTILGSNSKSVYIFFACDGLITQLWGIPDPAFAEILNINIKFINPIVLETSVGSLGLSEMDKEVEEGEKFVKKPTITVKDTNGNPMENKLVIASLYMSEGRILPHKFDRLDSGYRKKKILYPIPGNYSSDFTNPFTDQDYFVPFYTNKSGMIAFNDLIFSAWGASGSFQIIFECEGVFTLSPIINVISKVSSVNIIIQPSGYISSSNGKIDNQLEILVQVLGKNDKPIVGKTPSIKVLKEDKTAFPDTEIKITLDTENESFNPSDQNGFVRLYFNFGFIKGDRATTIFKIAVDSAFANTVPIVIEDIVVGVSNMCGSVKITGFNKDIRVGEIVNPTPKIKILSVSGAPLQKAYVKLDSRFSSDGPTDLPSGILPNLLMEDGHVSNENGVVILNDFKFSRGVYSTFQFFAKVFVIMDSMDSETSQKMDEIFKEIKEAEESEIDEIMTQIEDLVEFGLVQVCQSDPVEILLRPVLSKITIDYTLTSQLFSGLNINLGSFKIFKLNLYDYDGILIKNNVMPINFQKLQLPYYLTFKKLGLYHQDQMENELSISNSNANLIDKNGDMYIYLKVNEGTPGKYAINFFATGVYSQAVLFQTNFNFKKIEQVTSFTSNYDPNVGIPAGIPLNQAYVKVIGTDGYPAINCAVYAQIYNTNSKGFIDYSEATYDRDPFAVISTHRIAFTQMNGLASFNKLTLAEVTESTCVQFVFYVGDKDQYIFSDPTPKFCFKSDSNFDTKNSLYSKVISMNNPFVNPIIIKYRKNKLTDLMKEGVFIVAAVPFEVASGAVSYPLEMSKLFLRNYVCVYKGLIATKSSAKICSKEISLQEVSNGPVSFEIQMQGLRWTQSAFSTSLYLSFSNIFSYTRPVNPNDTTFNNYTRFIGTKESEKIEVSNTPSILEISAQPPSVVYVGDVFEVRVVCKVSSGSPIVKGEVKASLVQYGTQTGNTTYQKVKSLLFNFASGKTDINSIKEYTKKNSNAEMEYNGTIAKTNRKGQVSFNLKILSGLPGVYALIFETQALQTRPSSPFTLINRIVSLGFIAQPSLSYTISDDLQTLSSQPKMNITFRENLIDLRVKKVEVRIYKSPEKEVIEAYQKQLNDSLIETKSNLDYIIQTKLSESSVLQDDFTKVITNLANAVVNGGKIVASAERVTESFKVETGEISQDADGSLKFKNLKVQWPVPGKYCLLVVVNGMESELSQEIEVKEVEISIEVYILSILQKLLIIVLSVCAILANSAGISYFWTLAGFAGAGLILGLMDFIDAETMWKIIIYVITSLIILVLFEIVWGLICYFRSPRRKKSTMIFHVREETFYEYTYQMLFHRKSENWKNNSKGEYMNPFIKLAQKLEDNNEKNSSDSISPIKKDIEMVPIGKSPTASPDPFSPSPFSGSKLKPDDSDKEIEIFDQVYKRRADKIGIVANFKRVFVPFFSPYLKDDWVINDCFFYPQRFIASSLLGVVSVAYFAYQFFDSLQGVFQKIEDMGSNIRSSYMAFMGGALSSFKQAFGDEKFDEQTFKAGQNFVNWVSVNLETIGRCLSIGFYVGSSISLFVFVILMFCTFYNFKMRCLDFRKGVFCIPKEKLSIVGATGFVGTQTAVSMVSFLIMSIVVGIAFTVLVHPLFWELLFENIVTIIVVVALAILNFLIQTFILKYMIHEIEGVKKRKLYAIYELYTNFSEILGGILTALGRILKQIILSLVSLLRIDESLLPEWIYLKNNMDGSNGAFLSAVYMYHTHNHPICVTFANICGVISNNLRKIKEKNGEDLKKYFKKAQLANRMHVYLLLQRHPELQKYRKSKEKKKDDKEKVTEKSLKEDIIPLKKMNNEE